MEKLEPVKNEPKKPYSPPTLTIFGTVLEMTKRIGSRGNADGGVFPRNRTSV